MFYKPHLRHEELQLIKDIFLAINSDRSWWWRGRGKRESRVGSVGDCQQLLVKHIYKAVSLGINGKARVAFAFLAVF